MKDILKQKRKFLISKFIWKKNNPRLFCDWDNEWVKKIENYKNIFRNGVNDEWCKIHQYKNLFKIRLSFLPIPKAGCQAICFSLKEAKQFVSKALKETLRSDASILFNLEQDKNLILFDDLSDGDIKARTLNYHFTFSFLKESRHNDNYICYFHVECDDKYSFTSCRQRVFENKTTFLQHEKSNVVLSLINGFMQTNPQ